MSDTPIPDECWTDINFVLAKCRQLGREVAELRAVVKKLLEDKPGDRGIAEAIALLEKGKQ